MAKVTFENVIKKYGDVLAVDNLNLELEDGKFTVLVGPSGCGKTTTLRMIAGLEEVSSGKISINQKDVTSLEPKDRDISMVFQNYALYAHLTVAENIIFPLLARGGKREDAQKRLQEVAQILNISHLLERKPKELSGGQQQRVAIGRAIVRAPQVFLFDEPLSNLDAKLRVEMRTELLRLQKQLKTTTVYVTHDQEEAMTLSDVMIVMKDGKILQKGLPIEIYEKPYNTFVASFVGSPRMNLINGSCDGGVFSSPSGIKTTLSYTGVKKVILGVRPEEIMIGSESEAEFTAKVEIIEPLGPRAIVTLQVSNESLTAVINASDMGTLQEGSLVGVKFRKDKAHIFDEATQLRL
ncbi:MAG: ABC transporter ATP-binding protein [Candidatus Planktophila sp.]